jgi:hypothetical protein
MLQTLPKAFRAHRPVIDGLTAEAGKQATDFPAFELTK